MNKTHEFQTYELNINEEERDLLCNKIKEKAQSQNILTEPHIQYNLLLKNISSQMQSLCEEWIFTYKNEKSSQIEEIDFKNNTIMFSVRVLKSLFSNNKSTISLQSKNLDILSFYVNDKPWQNKFKTNNLAESPSEKYKINNHTYIVSGLITSILIIGFLLFKVIGLNKEIYDINNQYQTSLKLAQAEYFKLYKIDYYKTPEIPDSSIILCQVYFDNNTANHSQDGFNLKIIKNHGAFIEEPGIKENNILGTPLAFGFGKTSCIGNCYEPNKHYLDLKNCSILRLIPQQVTYFTYIELKWVEIGKNFGSNGFVFINQNNTALGKWPDNNIGVLPPSNYLIDESVHRLVLKIDTLVKTIDIAVLDIANESEIFINEIKIYSNPK